MRSRWVVIAADCVTGNKNKASYLIDLPSAGLQYTWESSVLSPTWIMELLTASRITILASMKFTCTRKTLRSTTDRSMTWNHFGIRIIVGINM